MLITSKKDSTTWLIPGGGIEATEQEFEAVSREAWEEAGVRGQVVRKLGLFEVGWMLRLLLQGKFFYVIYQYA